MKKSLLLVPPWYPNRENPFSGVFYRTMARSLSSRYEVSVLYVHIARGPIGGPRIEVERDGAVFVYRCYLRRRFYFKVLLPLIHGVAFLRGLRRLNREGRRPDLIFALGLLPCGLGTLAAKILHGTPYVTRESYSGFASEMKSAGKRFFARRILAAARRNYPVSTYQLEVMRRYFPEADFQVLGNAISPFEAQIEPAPPAPPFRVIYVGNLAAVKGWDVLIEGLALYNKREQTEVRLTIIGGGGQEADLKKTIQALGLGECVDFLGPQPHETVRPAIARHHFLVLPSRIDTCPNVVLEALSVGRPVLATRSGGAQDMVRADNGVLIDRDSPEAIAEGLAAMIARYEQFDPESIARTTEERHGIHVLTRAIDSAMAGGKRAPGAEAGPGSP